MNVWIDNYEKVQINIKLNKNTIMAQVNMDVLCVRTATDI